MNNLDTLRRLLSQLLARITRPGPDRSTGSSRRGYGTGYASSIVLEDDTIVTMTGAGAGASPMLFVFKLVPFSVLSPRPIQPGYV